MSLYRAHKPILELKTDVTDWYGNILWISVDKKGYKPVSGYLPHSKTKHSFYPRSSRWGVNTVASTVLVDVAVACKLATTARFKLTNRRQRCKILSRYRRPTIDVSIQNKTSNTYKKQKA